MARRSRRNPSRYIDVDAETVEARPDARAYRREAERRGLSRSRYQDSGFLAGPLSGPREAIRENPITSVLLVGFVGYLMGRAFAPAANVVVTPGSNVVRT